MSLLILDLLNFYHKHIILWALISAIIIYFLGKKYTLNINEKPIFISVGVYVYIVMFVCMYLYPYKVDDYILLLEVNSKDAQLNKLQYFFSWLWHSYQHMNGRLLLYIMYYIFFRINNLFEIIGPLMYICYLYFSYKIISSIIGRKGIILFLITLFALYITHPVSSSTIMWQSAAMTHFFPTTFILGVMYVYIKYYQKCREDAHYLKNMGKKQKYIFWVLFFVMGAISGWSTENAGAVVVFFACYMLFIQAVNVKERRIQIKKIPFFQMHFFLGALLGFSMLVFAPGTFNRIERSKEQHTRIYNIISTHDIIQDKLSVFNGISNRVVRGIQDSFDVMLGNSNSGADFFNVISNMISVITSNVVYIIFVIFAVFIISNRIKNIKYYETVKSKIIAFKNTLPVNDKCLLWIGIVLSSLVGYYIGIFPPTYPRRADFFPQTLLTISIITLVMYAQERFIRILKYKSLCKAVQFTKIFIFFIMLFSFLDTNKNQMMGAWYIGTGYKVLASYIEEEKSKGNLDVVIPRNLSPKVYESKYFGKERFQVTLTDIVVRTGEGGWFLPWMAIYFGLNSLKMSLPPDKEIISNQK